MRSLSSITPMLEMSWLNAVKRLRNGFGPKENSENSSNSKYFFFLNNSERRSRTQSEVKAPSFSARKSAAAIETFAREVGATK